MKLLKRSTSATECIPSCQCNSAKKHFNQTRTPTLVGWRAAPSPRRNRRGTSAGERFLHNSFRPVYAVGTEQRAVPASIVQMLYFGIRAKPTNSIQDYADR